MMIILIKLLEMLVWVQQRALGSQPFPTSEHEQGGLITGDHSAIQGAPELGHRDQDSRMEGTCVLDVTVDSLYPQTLDPALCLYFWV